MSNEKIFRLEKREHIGIVVFNVIDEAMNTWTENALLSFRAVLEELEQDDTLTGVVFISGKPNNFFAGANLKIIEQLNNRTDAMDALNLFHDSFNRTSALKMPTVAAINGACVGGGLEFVLACTARIATDAKTTVIGLPECNVGLFPGGGGSQRLPRLIGYPAVELILRGTLLPGTKAFQAGSKF